MRRLLPVLPSLVLVLVAGLLGGTTTAASARAADDVAPVATVRFDDMRSWMGCYDQAYSYDLHLPDEAVAWELDFSFAAGGPTPLTVTRGTDRMTGPDSGRTVLQNRCGIERQAGVHTVTTTGRWYDADGGVHAFDVATTTYRSAPAGLRVRLTSSPKKPRPGSLYSVKFRVTHEERDGWEVTSGVVATLEAWDAKRRTWVDTRKTLKNGVKYQDRETMIMRPEQRKFRARIRPAKLHNHLFGGRLSNVLVVKPRR